MGNRVIFFSLSLLSSVLLAGCHERSLLVPYEECELGYTAQCTARNQCIGVQKCGEDKLWGDCQLPAGSPASCEPPPKPECDVNAAVTEDKSCYTGPAGTKWKGICRPGYEICKDGKNTCAYQQTPQARNCSNGQDNDCDGVVDRDQGTNTQQTADVVLFIDESGSMGPYIEVIKLAIVQFANASASSSTQIRIAAVGVPHGEDGKCGLITNFTDPTTAGAVIDGLMIQSSNFGSEPTIDCPFFAASPENPLGLTYRTGIKRTFISFTDEEAQSYQTPRISAFMAGQAMASRRIQFYSFDRLSERRSFQDMTGLTGGRSFELERSYTAIQQDLVNLFLEIICTR